MANLNYESTNETLGDFSPVPVDSYLAVITESEVKNASTGGVGINLKFEIMEGDYAGRFVFTWINFQHANPKAEQIGRKELNTIMLACGMPPGTMLEDTCQLHGFPMVINVGIENDNKGNPKNNIKGYKAADDAGKPQAQTQRAQAAGNAATSQGAGANQNQNVSPSNNTPSWRK